MEKKNTERISHDAATLMLKDFLVRLQEVNRSVKYAFFVHEVYLFGSYLKGASEVGDVDIAADFMMKSNAKVQSRADELLTDAGQDIRGKCFDVIEERRLRTPLYAQLTGEVEAHLQGGCRWIEIASTSTVRRRRFPYRKLYQIPRRDDLIRLIAAGWGDPDVTPIHEFIERHDGRTKLFRSLVGR